MVVRELFARLGFDVDRSSLKKADQAIGGVKMALKAVAAAAVVVAGVKIARGLAGILNTTALMADELGATAARLGLTVEQLQKLQFVADRADMSAEELTMGLRTLARVAYNAANGGKEAAALFRKLGVDIRDGSGQLKPTIQLMEESADGFAALASTTEKQAIAQALFGRSGLAMVPMLNKGTKAIQEQMEMAKKFGVVTEELVQLGSDYDNSQKDLKRSIQGVKNLIAKALLPAVNKQLEAMGEWIRANRDWIASGISNVVLKFGQVLMNVARFLRDVWHGFRDVVNNIAPVIKGLIAIKLALIGIALVNPVTWLLIAVALVALLIDDFKVWQEGGESLFGKFATWLEGLTGKLGVIRDIFIGVGEVLNFILDTFFTGISAGILTLNSFMKGDFKGAWRNLKLGYTEALGPVVKGMGSSFTPEALDANARRVNAIANQSFYGYGNSKNTVNAPVTINAPPGMSADEIGAAVTRHVTGAFNPMLRSAQDAFTSAAVPVTEQ